MSTSITLTDVTEVEGDWFDDLEARKLERITSQDTGGQYEVEGDETSLESPDNDGIDMEADPADIIAHQSIPNGSRYQLRDGSFQAHKHKRQQLWPDDYENRFGNVIGIRGLSSKSKREDERYTKLWIEYHKLRAQHHSLLFDFLEKVNQQFELWIKGESKDFKDIKLLLNRQNEKLQQHRNCAVCHDKLGETEMKRTTERLKIELEKLREELQFKDEERQVEIAEMNQKTAALRDELERKDEEISKLNKKIKNLALEPKLREIERMKSENESLKNLNSNRADEIQRLSQNYAELEKLVEAKMGEHDDDESIHKEKVTHFMMECFRLQVKQSKLDEILSNQNTIKENLKVKIDRALSEKELLAEELAEKTAELAKSEKLTAGRKDREIHKLSALIRQQQEKYDRLREEKESLQKDLQWVEERCNMLESRVRADSNNATKDSRTELDRLRNVINNIELEKRDLEIKVEELVNKTNKTEKEKCDYLHQLCELHKRLESCRHSKDDHREDQLLLGKEQLLKDLEAKLVSKESECRQIRTKYKDLEDQIEFCRKQNEELRTKFELQSKSIDEINAKKDKELAKLKVDLNYERYNRQVALRSAETELKASLLELQSMKHNLSNQKKSFCLNRRVKVA